MPEIDPLIDEEIQTNISIFEILREDCRTSAFSLTEPNGKIIDVEASFIPEPKWSVYLFRNVCFIFTLVVTYHSFRVSTVKLMWFGYLTHWSALVTLLYQGPILVCSMRSSLLPQPKPNETPYFLLRFIWAAYSVAISAEFFVTLLYWTLIHDWSESPTFLNIALHGIFAVLLVLDGVLIGKIPMRLKHLLFVEVYGICYIIWSFIHCLETVDDPIYNVLDWTQNPVFAGVLSIISAVFLLPIIFLTLWFLSYTSYCFGSRRILILA